MSEFIKLPEFKLRVKDAFAYNELLELLDAWFNENSYKPKDDTYPEEVYTHKYMAGGAMVDSWIWWRFLKYPSGANSKTAFFRYGLDLDLDFLGDANETEVLHKGKKVKLNKGELFVFIRPYLELDFRNEWKTKGVLGLVADVFKKNVYKKQIENNKDYIYNEGYRLQAMIKRFFKLETNVPEEATAFYPKGLQE